MRYLQETPDTVTFEAGESLEYHREALELATRSLAVIGRESEQVLDHLRGVMEALVVLGGPGLRQQLVDLTTDFAERHGF